jgi:hypothetical protein
MLSLWLQVSRRFLFVSLPAITATALGIGGCSDFLAVDSCLDKGGCWDRSRSVCEFHDQCKCTPERCIRNEDGILVPDIKPADVLPPPVAVPTPLPASAGVPATPQPMDPYR